MELLLQLDPTTFNFVSDIVAFLLRAAFDLALVGIYALFLTWHFKSGRTIGLKDLAKIPSGFFGSMYQAKRIGPSLPILMLVLLYFVADLSHSLADTGMAFISVNQEGPADAVLNLWRRNPKRLMHTAGDPTGSLTAVKVELHQSDLTNASAVEQAQAETAVVSNFLGAAQTIARGDSPFVKTDLSKRVSLRRSWGSIPNVLAHFNPDDTPHVTMDLELPVACASSEMVQVNLISGIYNEPRTNPVRSTAQVPNCTFTQPRATGIFQKSKIPKAGVLETVFFRGTIKLQNDTGLYQDFTATPKIKELARNRKDWRQGRRLPGLQSIQVSAESGQTLTVPLDYAILALGAESLAVPFQRSINGPTEWQRHNTYGLVVKPSGGCPMRPSGLPTNDMQCLGIIELYCEAFQEDFVTEISKADDIDIYIPNDSQCSTNSLEFLWGRNFVVDQEFTAVVAGMYGRIRPDAFDGTDSIVRFHQNVMFAALFALGTIDSRPSTATVVRPQINVVYIIFMIILPLLVACMLAVAFCLARKSLLPLPRNAWDVLILGGETSEYLTCRDEKTHEFPPVDNSKLFGLNEQTQKLVIHTNDGTEMEGESVPGKVGRATNEPPQQPSPLELDVLETGVHSAEPLTVWFDGEAKASLPEQCNVRDPSGILFHK